MTATGLGEGVASLIARARIAYADTAADSELAAIESRLREPLRVAIAGKVKAGKSTLLNALVGEPLARTGTGECTKVVTWYREGQRYRAFLDPIGAERVEIAVRRGDGGIAPDLEGWDPDEVERLVVEWPSSRLRTMTLIDTPGVGSISGAGRRTLELLAPDDDHRTPADAVLYLTPHLHADDVGFLEAFHDDANARATPVNALGVLSRADEIGGARSDSVRSAAKVAARYATEPTLRRLCQTVVPVAGLLAEAAVTLTEEEFRWFGRVAALPVADADALLLTADRFAAFTVDDSELDVERRAALLERFGLFGVRVANDLVRRGRAATARQLAAELTTLSGIDALERLLATRFTARSDVLKSRSALIGVEDVFRRWPPVGAAGNDLRVTLERIRAGAHELAELRLLVAVRAGDVPLDDEAVDELERVLTPGHIRERLQLGEGDEITDALVDGVARWRRRAEHPLASPSVMNASAIVVRAYESMLPETHG